MKTFVKFGLGLVVALVIGVSAPAEDRKPIEKTEKGDPASDQEFLAWAIAADVGEVKFAEKALESTRNPDVKKFATRMRDDHSKHRDELLERAKEMKVGVVEGLDKDRRDKMAQLSKLEGNSFDREYMNCMVEGHEKVLRLYEKWSDKSSDSKLRELCRKTVPVVKEHLEEARRIARDLRK